MEEFGIVLITLALLLFSWALMDLLKRGKGWLTSEKIVCFLFILFVPLIGPLFYLLLRKRYKSLRW